MIQKEAEVFGKYLFHICKEARWYACKRI